MNTVSANPPPLTPTTEKALKRFQAVKSIREERYRSWVRFYESAKATVTALALERKDIAYFLPYDFHVIPGGQAGALDDLTVDVIFGIRLYDVSGDVGGQGKRPLKTHSETGASLRYERTDSGQVLCLLSPGRAERTHSIVSMVLLERIRHPNSLNKRTLSRHLASLAAYMAATSLDGSPTIGQRLRYAIIYVKCRYARANGRRMQPSRLSVGASKLLWWVFTVGLSGTVLFLLQRAIGNPS
ncbi:hypothetical protein VWT76_15855 [Xanthomonas citri pv. citri]|uniref:hypothetical protein n=1 Tax=Xanthomonas citri TaxID=346 RepID=UPI000ABC0A85|nr:hypothetical protein [Xanthomonas citri]MBD5034971.1 hypothetical protein [Xanthomonas citri pv. citri]MBD5054745.1 hypothetical protein [Xanthomonas citri pv. citri]